MSDSSSRDDRIAAGCLQVLGFLVFGIIFLVSVMPDSGPDYSSSNDLAWDRYDITIDVREDGSMHITEYQEIDFDGNYSAGFVEIPMERIESIDNVSVTLERGVPVESTSYGDDPEGEHEEAREVAWAAFNDRPNTFRARQEGDLYLIDYAFDPVSRYSFDYANNVRTVIIEYDVYGVVRDYPDADEPWQQFHWLAISDEVTAIAPIREASVTVNLPETVDGEDLVVVPEASSNDGRTIAWTRTGMDEGDSFDVQAAFPTITDATAPAWQPAADARDASIEEREQRQSAGQLMLILAGIAIVVVGGLTTLYAWYRGIREPQVGLVHQEITDPPGDLPAVLVGSLLDEHVHPRDIAAGVLDLDRQGLLTIRNGEPSEPEGYYLTLNRPIPIRPLWAREIVVTIFGENAREGDTRGFSALRDLFGSRRHALQHAIDQTLVEDGYYEELPETSRKHWTWVTYGFAIAGLAAAIAILIWVRGFTAWALIPPAVGLILFWVGRRLTPNVAQKTNKGAETASMWRAFERHLISSRGWLSGGTVEHQRASYAPWLLAFGIEQGWLSEMNRPSWESPRPSSTSKPALEGWLWGESGTSSRPSTSTRPSGKGAGSGRSVVQSPSWRPISGNWDAGRWSDMQGASDSFGKTLSSMSDSTFKMMGDMLEAIGSSSGGGGGSSGGRSSSRRSSSRSGGGRSRSSSGGGRRGFR